MKAVMGFRLAQSHLTLDDLEGQKTKVTVFDVKYVENDKSYDDGPNGDYVDSSSLDLLPKIFGLLVITTIIIFVYHWSVVEPIAKVIFST